MLVSPADASHLPGLLQEQQPGVVRLQRRHLVPHLVGRRPVPQQQLLCQACEQTIWATPRVCSRERCGPATGTPLRSSSAPDPSHDSRRWPAPCNTCVACCPHAEPVGFCCHFTSQHCNGIWPLSTAVGWPVQEGRDFKSHIGAPLCLYARKRVSARLQHKAGGVEVRGEHAQPQLCGPRQRVHDAAHQLYLQEQ